MCPRATARHAMARAAACASVAAAASAHSFGEEEYIDLDLSSCGEFEFRLRRSSADELLCRGGAAATHKTATTKSAAKTQEVGAGGGGRRSAATVAPLQHSHSAGFFRDAPPAAATARAEGSRRRKAARTVQAKLQASRAFFRSLFARTSCSEERCRGAPVRAWARATPYGETKKGGYRKAPFGEIRNGCGSVVSTSASRAAPTTLRSSIEQEKLMDEEELAARQRKSFSGVIRWRHATTTSVSPASATAKPLSSSSARRSSNGAAGPALKRSNSARSESEGLIQGAIAYCKRSQQQLGLARKSVSDAAAPCPGGGGPPAWPSNPTRSAPAYCYY
jgi:hypothetical protein